LVIVLASAFEKLPMTSRLLHGCSLMCIAVAVILLVTPAALHRIVWAGEDSERFLHVGGQVTIAALVPLALGMAGDAYVVFVRLTDSSAWGAAAAAAVSTTLLGFWLGWPLAMRRRRNTPATIAVTTS
jgi:hypothetical protein